MFLSTYRRLEKQNTFHTTRDKTICKNSKNSNNNRKTIRFLRTTFKKRIVIDMLVISTKLSYEYFYLFKSESVLAA